MRNHVAATDSHMSFTPSQTLSNLAAVPFQVNHGFWRRGLSLGNLCTQLHGCVNGFNLFQAGSGLAKEHGPWKSEIDILPKTKQNPSGPGDAQHTLFSPMPSYRWSFVAAARIRQRLPSGLLGLTRRKLGAMTSRAEKLTWHISRCRHIRTDNIFGLRNLGRSTNLTTCANLATSCEAAVAPFWLEASQVRSWWALLRDCNETDHPLDQWNPMKSHLFGQVSTVQLQISGIELDIFFAP